MHFLFAASRGHLFSLQKACPVLGWEKAKKRRFRTWPHVGTGIARDGPGLLAPGSGGAFFLGLSQGA